MKLQELVTTPAAKLLPVVKEIVFWKNRLGTESHCLGRIFVEPNRPIVMLSEIRSNVFENRKNPGIFSDLAAPINILVQKYQTLFNPANDNILWIAHCGSFSDFDIINWTCPSYGFEHDNFYKATIVKNSDGRFKEINSESNDLRQLKGNELQETLGHIDIEDIYKICEEINWTRIIVHSPERGNA